MTSEAPVNIALCERLFLDEQTRRLQALGLLRLLFAVDKHLTGLQRRFVLEAAAAGAGSSSGAVPARASRLRKGRHHILIYFQILQTAALAF